MKKTEQKTKIAGTVPKTFHQMGKWIERKTRSEILVCACGNKYIKTRTGQSSCLRCMNKRGK